MQLQALNCSRGLAAAARGPGKPRQPARRAPTEAAPPHDCQRRHSGRALRPPCAAAAGPSGAAAVAASPQQLEAQQQPGWVECVQQLQQLGFSDGDAQQCVQRAFGWGKKAAAFWRHEKSEEPADPQQLAGALKFLSQLGMDEAQVAKVVKQFPEVLGCDVSTQLGASADKLRKEWRLEGEVLLKAVLRNPAVLGYNLDCMGDCAGECNRCWARF